jgi:hypothetical protein
MLQRMKISFILVDEDLGPNMALLGRKRPSNKKFDAC